MAKLRVRGDFPTIQAAVDRAEAGDVIVVEEGVYRESVIIEKEGISLLGEGAVLVGGLSDRNSDRDSDLGSVEVSGRRGNQGCTLADGFELRRADRICIEGFCLREFDSSGFFCHDSTRIVIRNCSVENCGTDGIYLTRCEDVHLFCSDFSANGVCGIEVHDSPDLLAAGGRVISNGGNGIYCGSRDSAGINLRGCEISRNNGAGILAEGCNIGIIECEIMGNVMDGIRLCDCPGSEIKCTSVSAQWENGCVINSDRCEISESRIASNEGTGLYITGDGCDVTSNLISRNGGSGILLTGIRNYIASNTVTQNTPFDIVRAAPNNVIKKNVTCNDNPPLNFCDRNPSRRE